MTTRRHPRTLSEAFPHGPEYGCAIERPAPNPYPRMLWVAMAIGVIAVILTLVFE